MKLTYNSSQNIAHIFIVQHKLDIDPCETGERFDFRLSKRLVRLRKADYALHLLLITSAALDA